MVASIRSAPSKGALLGSKAEIRGWMAAVCLGCPLVANRYKASVPGAYMPGDSDRFSQEFAPMMAPAGIWAWGPR